MFRKPLIIGGEMQVKRFISGIFNKSANFRALNYKRKKKSEKSQIGSSLFIILSVLMIRSPAAGQSGNG